MTNREILLIYDKECPVCDAYCRMIRIRKSIGTLKLVNARDGGAALDEITALGIDIDQGMVLKVEDNLYYGADAIHALTLMSSPSGIFNRLNYHVFRSRHAAKILYPILRSSRDFLLKTLGKPKINNLQLKNNEKF